MNQRKSIEKLPPEELERLKEAFRILQARPESQPNSYAALARIHAGHCVHYNEFFLSWHRAYLLHFERRLQEALGDETLTVPYWNWSKNRRVPAPFWEEPLLHSPRTATPDKEMDTARVAIDDILAEPTFAKFGGRPWPRQVGGQLEKGPHDYIHVSGVGGDMDSSLTAARDPVFWAHHSNIDRLWAKWQESHSGTPSPQEFSRPLVPFRRTVGDMLNTYQLGYEYVSDVSEFEIDLHRAAGGLITYASMRAANGLKRFAELQERPEQRIELRIEDIELPHRRGQELRLFFNLPEADAQTSLTDVHYAGSFFLIAMSHMDEHSAAHAPSAVALELDVTAKLQELAAVRPALQLDSGVCPW